MSAEHSLTQTQVLTSLVQRCDNGDVKTSRGELCEEFDRSTSVVGRALGNLIFRKLVRTITMGEFTPTAAGKKLIADGGTVNSGPRPGKIQGPRNSKEDSLRARLWRGIITLKRFTISDLVARAARDTDKNAAPAARRYINYLKNAGFLIELPHRSRSGAYPKQGEKIFWLKDAPSGRKPPRVKKSQDGQPGMFDPNNRTYHPFAKTESKAA